MVSVFDIRKELLLLGIGQCQLARKLRGVVADDFLTGLTHRILRETGRQLAAFCRDGLVLRGKLFYITVHQLLVHAGHF